MSDVKRAVSNDSYFGIFKEITKVRLSISVVFSSLAGYLLGAEIVQIKIFLLLAIGGYCMVGASNVFNQILEKDLDALMLRTRNRPLPSGRIDVRSAFILASVLTLAGIGILYTSRSFTQSKGSIQ